MYICICIIQKQVAFLLCSQNSNKACLKSDTFSASWIDLSNLRQTYSMVFSKHQQLRSYVCSSIAYFVYRRFFTFLQVLQKIVVLSIRMQMSKIAVTPIRFICVTLVSIMIFCLLLLHNCLLIVDRNMTYEVKKSRVINSMLYSAGMLYDHTIKYLTSL